MEEINPVLKGRCVTEKSDFKVVTDHIWEEAVQWHRKEVPESQRTGLVWTSEVQDCEKTWRPALLHCVHKASKNRTVLPFTLPNTWQGKHSEERAQTLQRGARFTSEQERLWMSPLCPLLSNKEVLGCLNSRILSVHPGKDTAQTVALHLPCVLFPRPAVTCMQW